MYSGLYIFCQYVFPGNRTHNLCAVNAMLYQLSHRNTITQIKICQILFRFFDYFEDLYTLAKLQIVVKCNYTAELQWRYWKSTTLVSYQHCSELPLPVTSHVPSDQMLPLRSGWVLSGSCCRRHGHFIGAVRAWTNGPGQNRPSTTATGPENMTTWDLDDVEPSEMNTHQDWFIKKYHSWRVRKPLMM